MHALECRPSGYNTRGAWGLRPSVRSSLAQMAAQPNQARIRWGLSPRERPRCGVDFGGRVAGESAEVGGEPLSKTVAPAEGEICLQANCSTKCIENP